MGSYDGAEICELVGIYILTRLATIIKKSDCGLYRDDGLVILRNVNGQQIDRTRKNIIKIFKDIGFGIDIETNSKVVDFLDITFNLNNGIYKPYKKPNDRLLYINKSSNHPPQIINQLPKIISDRLSRNSSNKEVFNTAKGEYEEAINVVVTVTLVYHSTNSAQDNATITSYDLTHLIVAQSLQTLQRSSFD